MMVIIIIVMINMQFFDVHNSVTKLISFHHLLETRVSISLRQHRHVGLLTLRYWKGLGFTPPFVRRASYFRANLSEDCYSFLEFSKIENKEVTFIRIVWIIIRKVSGTRIISMRIYSHFSTSKTLIINIKFISTFYNRQIKSLNEPWKYQTR
jgi:hypothetical protein